MNSVGWQRAAWGKWHIKYSSASLLRSIPCLQKQETGTHRSHPSALAASIPGHQADGAGAALSWEDARGGGGDGLLLCLLRAALHKWQRIHKSPGSIAPSCGKS